MKIYLDNILCHQSLNFTLNKGANLVTGKNSSGKTSIATALAALGTHSENPMSLGVTKQKDYITQGMGEGCATMEIDGEPSAKTMWRPGQGIERSPKSEPISIPQAVGGVDFAKNTTPKERAKMWEEMFLPKDPEDILRPHCEGISELRIQGLLELIRDRGWPDAVKVVEGQRLESKRRWAHIAGEAYGDKKAAGWTPPNWRDELTGKSEESVLDELKFRKGLLSKAEVSQGIDAEMEKQVAEKRDKISELALSLKEIQAKKSEMSKTRDSLSNQYADAVEKRSFHAHDQGAFRQIIASAPTYKCPHCNEGIDMVRGTLAKWDSPSGKEISDAEAGLKKSMTDDAALEAEVNALKVNCNFANEKCHKFDNEISRIVHESELLKRQVDSYKPESVNPDAISESEQEALRVSVSSSRADFEALTKKQAADVERSNVVELDCLCAILGPTGARADIMSNAMDGVRHIVAVMCKSGGWDKITMGHDYALMSNGRSIALCAHNEKMKAQWAFQIASAIVSDSRLLVLDAADLLRDESWDGLVEILNQLAKSSPDMVMVVAATSTDCPDGWNKVQV